MTTVLVTGATGTVGRHVVDALADREAVRRAGVRDPEGDGAADADEVVDFDFERPETWGASLSDAGGVFLLRPPTVDAADVGAFAEAADRVGVRRVAYLSTLGAERNPLLPPHRVERRVAAMGLDHTFPARRSSCRTSPRFSGRTWWNATRCSSPRATGGPVSSTRAISGRRRRPF